MSNIFNNHNSILRSPESEPSAAKNDNNYDVIIIGGGFSGLTCALNLAKSSSHLQILILEKNDIITQDKKRDGRAFAISKKSLGLFEKIGIAENLRKVAGKITDIRITDGDSPFYLDFSGEEVDKDSSLLGLVIENYHIHNQLRNQLLKQSNVKILSPISYKNIINQENSVSVILDNDEIINAKLLIAADGRFSQIREKFKIKTYQKSYNQSALVFNISHQKPHLSVAQERFLPDGPFAILPMFDDCHSSIVWTTTPEMAQTILNLDQENFLQQLTKRTTNYLGEIKLLTKPFKYDLSLTVADQYYYRRTVFISDAIHAIHPIAGQGFNVGIDDIIVLNELIKDHQNAGLDIGSKTLLSNYQNIRKAPVYKMVAATHGLNLLFSNKNLPLKMVRDLGLGLVEKIPKLKQFFIKNAGGVDGSG